MASVRQQINIDASPRTVWKQLTTSEGLMAWWADEARVDAVQGGRITVTTEDDAGEPMQERGIIVESRPTRRFEIKWDAGSQGPAAGSLVKFQVARDGEETRVSLIHTGAFLEDAEMLERFDKEWRASLKALRSSLEQPAE